MTDPFAGVEQALADARAAWESARAGEAPVDGRSGASIAALSEAVGLLRRSVDAVHVQVAAEVARASRQELGNAGLAKQQGFRTPAAMIAASTGTSVGEAARLVAVGEATTPRMTLTGAEAPPKYPEVAGRLDAQRISVAAAAAIVALLDKVALRVPTEGLQQAERTLVQQASGLALDQLNKILQRAEAWLDPDGVEPREAELRGRAWHFHEDRSGMLVISAKLDPETAAPVKAAIEAMVGAELRNQDSRRCEREAGVASGLPDEDRRTIPQMQADAIAMICRHMRGCDSKGVPTGGSSVVVRIGLEQLVSGEGHGTIDGMAQPVSVATIRRMAADAQIIPLVLGGDSEVLDFGRAKRLFTTPQKLALGERDGGCVGCGLPPGMTQVHHLRWWDRDTGPTDLDNGVLLCVRCHHRIHDDGWEIRIEGTGVRAKVWLIPPVYVDPTRTPRLGGRAHRDYVLSA
ncbi:DUF222 domain-containing protein [Microbacterium sp. CFH 90308]|uniref:DUF222 domain-containing protein n=1 Tax=Microbacterium salsuginis TaxID=2722803 RepID=A0ABX1K8B4_9MICO|nr:HNH endonuclease signature motif containing protein [Microbacterium sp. CFH 90308]NLP83194.1 DUF222 domain-containing protein [Microbacterium sp. CFH 90308]